MAPDEKDEAHNVTAEQIDTILKTFDEEKGVGILSGKAPSLVKLGPYRKAPAFYAGETCGTKKVIDAATKRIRRIPRPINYPDVERRANGTVPGVRNKFARRLIRKAFMRHHSKVEQQLRLPRAMLAQAKDIAKENGKSVKWARRLFARELAIHESVYVPSHKETRAIRTAKRKLKRQGKVDAITALVERMAKP